MKGIEAKVGVNGKDGMRKRGEGGKKARRGGVVSCLLFWCWDECSGKRRDIFAVAVGENCYTSW